MLFLESLLLAASEPPDFAGAGFAVDAPEGRELDGVADAEAFDDADVDVAELDDEEADGVAVVVDDDVLDDFGLTVACGASACVEPPHAARDVATAVATETETTRVTNRMMDLPQARTGAATTLAAKSL